MAGVEVVDRHPVELGAEVLFHARHQAPRQGFEVVVLPAVLGRDDEAELMAVPGPAFGEDLALDGIAVRTIQRTAFALARRAVALEVAQMRSGSRSALPGELDDAGLDHDAPARRPGRTTTACQHAPDARAARDPAAREAALAPAFRDLASTREIGGGEHAPEIGSAATPDAATTTALLTPETGRDVVLVSHVSCLPVAGMRQHASGAPGRKPVPPRGAKLRPFAPPWHWQNRNSARKSS